MLLHHNKLSDTIHAVVFPPQAGFFIETACGAPLKRDAAAYEGDIASVTCSACRLELARPDAMVHGNKEAAE